MIFANTMKVSLPQRFHKLYDTSSNAKIILDEIKKTKADLLIFPEVFLSGYLCRDKLFDVAELLKGKLVNKIVKAVKKKKCHLIFGMPERDEKVKGHIYNTAVYIDPKGELDYYRKMHLVNFGPFEDKRYFSEGHKLDIFKTELGNIGVIICYDIFFPELTKAYALQGADIILCISASPSVTRQFFEKMMVARAIENTTFVLYSNLIGTERNLVYWGGNAVIGPRGEVKTKGEYFKEDNVECDIDLTELKVARQFRPTLRDTRAEVFDTIQDIYKLKWSKK